MLKGRSLINLAASLLLVAAVLASPVLVKADSGRAVFAGLESVIWDRETNKYELQWAAATAAGKPEADITYHIYAATTPAVSSADYWGSVTGETSVSITGLEARQRYHFVVRAEVDGLYDRSFVVQAGRTLQLEGDPNFRDIGGYVNADGVPVRWGTYFRSGHLVELTNVDKIRVNNLDWSRIIDLRMDYDVERDKGRDATYEGNEDRYDLLPFHQGDEYLRNLVAPESPIPETWPLTWDLTQVDFPNWYVNVMEHNREGMKHVFERLADPDQHPIVVHCTAGKDRAGVITALLLLLLDVPRDTIMDDYNLTGDLTRDKIDSNLSTLEWAISEFPDLVPEGLTIEHWRQMNDINSEAMENMLDYVESEYGNVRAYLDDIGVSQENQDAIRDLLLVTDEPGLAGFSASADSGRTPLAVDFTDSSSGDITAWWWDFDGDGEIDSTEQSPSFTFEEPGEYTVTLAVEGPGGFDKASLVITVEEAEEKTSGFLGCECGGVSSSVSTQGLIMGWAITGLVLVGGRSLVRRLTLR